MPGVVRICWIVLAIKHAVEDGLNRRDPTVRASLRGQVTTVMVDAKPINSWRGLFKRLEIVTTCKRINIFINEFLCK
jgi:hypothetical protein